MKTARLNSPVVGIVSEYNPFHRGHFHQIAEARRALGPDVPVIAVMSGDFVQRGSPALFDKFLRAKLAVLGGVSLVFELPTYFATSAAPDFARGAVELFDKIRIVSHLSFGVETGSRASESVPDRFDEKLRTELSAGRSYASAYGRARGDSGPSPNRILADEYLRALEAIGSPIRPLPVERAGAGHHETDVDENTLPSAGAIRRRFFESGIFPSDLLPEPLRSVTRDLNPSAAALMSDFETMILWALRSTPLPKLAEIRGMREGIENRFVDCALRCDSYESLIESVKTKRYTRSSLDRALISVLLDIRPADYDRSPSYLRVLGFDETGRRLIRQIQHRSVLEVVTRWHASSARRAADPHLALDIRASKLYHTAKKRPLLPALLQPPYFHRILSETPDEML